MMRRHAPEPALLCTPNMYGLLNINKPATWTSRDVINWIEQRARQVKIGHAGTLDPLATGVLVVCLGHATRLVPFLHELPKTYVATFLFGRRSDSDDVDTEVELLAEAPVVTTEQLRAVLPDFIGTITQFPPTYSAVKVNGQRAYRKARKGKPVEMPEREVEVHRIVLIEHVGDSFTLEIECGTGTYIRSIGRDIAAACGSGAVMSSLCRTRIGEFTVDDSIAPSEVQRDTILELLLSPMQAVPQRPLVQLTFEEIPRVENGNAIPARPELEFQSREVALLHPSGEMIALADFDAETRTLTPRVVLRPPACTYTR